MSKEKYPSVFSRQMEAIVFYQFWKLGNITRILPSFGWGTFIQVTLLDQSRASENIWRIISVKYHFARAKGDLQSYQILLTP